MLLNSIKTYNNKPDLELCMCVRGDESREDVREDILKEIIDLKVKKSRAKLGKEGRYVDRRVWMEYLRWREQYVHISCSRR